MDMPQLSNDQLVAMLKSSDQKQRRLALDTLFPNECATLVLASPMTMSMTSSFERPNHTMFVALLWSAQTMARAFGLELNWVKQQDARDKIVLPGGLQLMR